MLIEIKNTTNNKSLAEIRQKALLRKANAELRHTPNASDIKVANDNAGIISKHQYKTIE